VSAEVDTPIMIQINKFKINISHSIKVLFMIILKPMRISFQIITTNFCRNFSILTMSGESFSNTILTTKQCMVKNINTELSFHQNRYHTYSVLKIFSTTCSQIPHTQDIWEFHTFQSSTEDYEAVRLENIREIV
jgi:hypothetical protein